MNRVDEIRDEIVQRFDNEVAELESLETQRAEQSHIVALVTRELFGFDAAINATLPPSAAVEQIADVLAEAGVGAFIKCRRCHTLIKEGERHNCAYPPRVMSYGMRA